MLGMILDSLERELGMARGTILLVSPGGDELMVEAAKSLASPEQQAVRYRRGEGIVGRVLQTGMPVVVPRISDEPEFRDRIHHRKEMGERLSFICVPILLGTEVIGTLSVDLLVQEPAALEEKQQVLTIVASMVAGDVKLRREAQRDRQILEDENVRLRSELGEQFRPENIIGNSHAMRQIYVGIQQVSAADTTVLIRGESGTGKELVASAIHYNSPRAKKSFVKVNCAALSETLIESELFGHERGAFTGALRDRVGRVEEAEGGTLFLDEVGDFSPAVQVKLLRVIQEREFSRVGSNRTQTADVRIITATNRDLEKAVESGAFRQDLYYRINVFPLLLPPLRERRDDILLLADHFVKKYSQRMGKDVRRISTTAINMMLAYHWPGNVRELENCIERAVLLSVDGVIHGDNLPPTLQIPSDGEFPPPGYLRNRVQLMEKDMIVDALKRSGGNASAAARELGITSRMIRYKVGKLGIALSQFET
jgi:Nif-specific regulatory protein